jgi:hypothetical protein
MGQSMQHMLGNVPHHYEDFSKLHHVIDLLGATGKAVPAWTLMHSAGSDDETPCVIDCSKLEFD